MGTTEAEIPVSLPRAAAASSLAYVFAMDVSYQVDYLFQNFTGSWPAINELPVSKLIFTYSEWKCSTMQQHLVFVKGPCGSTFRITLWFSATETH
jgi:hypothetical protein